MQNYDLLIYLGSTYLAIGLALFLIDLLPDLKYFPEEREGLKRQFQTETPPLRFSPLLDRLIRWKAHYRVIAWPIYVPERFRYLKRCRDDYRQEQQLLHTTVNHQHLGELVSIEDIVAEARVLYPVPNVLFGYRNSQWLKFKSAIKQGDAIFAFTEPTNTSDLVTDKRSGYALVRDQIIVHFFVVKSGLVCYPGTPQEEYIQ